MYKEKDGRTAIVRAWAAGLPVGTEYGITDAGDRFRATLPAYRSPSGYRGQTIARILCEQCGWMRNTRTIMKL